MTAPLNRHIQTHLIEMVREKLLLERISLNGIDVNIRNDAGENALYWAIKKHSIYNANLLMVFGSSLVVAENTHALFHAIACKKHELVVLLIDKGLDVNLTDTMGKTALMHAIEAGLFLTVKFLIAKGADMYLMDNALNMAEDYAKDSHCEMIRHYLQYTVQADMQENTCNSKQCACQ